MNIAWKAIEKWSLDNQIEINKKKSAVMIVKVDQRTPNPIVWDFNDIELQRQYKYLGIQLKDDLNLKLLTDS